MLKIFAAGTVGQDLEIRYFESGNVVGNFTVAVYMGKDGDGQTITEWIKCSIWGEKRVTSAAKLIKKGTKITISGSGKSTHYTNRQGDVVSQIEVRIDDFTVQNSREEQNQHQSHQQPRQERQPAQLRTQPKTATYITDEIPY